MCARDVNLFKWPKVPPVLSAAEEEAREKYMLLWHEQLPQKFAALERFNHGYVARLPRKQGSKTLEIGAGIGGHLEFEDVASQEYHVMEYREQFCKELEKKHPARLVSQGDIHARQGWADGYFDRIVAIHVLEHLVDLPKALAEISRLLDAQGVFDFVIPCEGGVAHTLGRKVTAERLFRKNFGMDFTNICKNEHVNTFREIMYLIRKQFEVTNSSYFPLKVPLHDLNLVAGFRVRKRGAGATL